MVSDSLIDYVNQTLKQGFSEDQVRDKLESAGHSKEDIDAAFAQSTPQAPDAKPEKTQKKPAKAEKKEKEPMSKRKKQLLMLLIAVLIVLVLVAVEKLLL